MEQEKVKVCAYCRVSTNSKDQENSFENQQSYFHREIAKDSRYELYKIYADKGTTGTSLNNRKQFNDMLYDAGLDLALAYNDDNDKRKDKVGHMFLASTSREPKFNRIIVKNTSRFARNILVLQIIRELAKKEVYIDFLDKNFSTDRPRDLETLPIFLQLDENESRDKSRKVKFGHEEGAKKGVVHTNDRLYGYRYLRESNSLEVIPHEAEVVRKIFTLYSQGIGFRRIINILNDEGIKTRNGREFGSSSLKRMLSNEKYAGINARLKYDTGTVFNKNSYPKVKDKDEWVIHEDSRIPAIIDKTLFELCCKIRESNVNYVWQKGQYKGISEYAGLIYCKRCGSVYTSNVDKGRRFYNCSLKKTKGTIECSNPNVSLKKLQEFLSELATNGYAEAVDEMKETQIKILEDMKKYLEKQIDADKVSTVEELTIQRDELVQQKQKLLPLYLKGKIDEQLLDDTMESIEKELTSVEVLIKENSKTNDELSEDIKKLSEGIAQIAGLVKDKDYTGENITEAIEKVLVLENGTLDVVFKQQAILLDMVKKYEHLVTEDFVESVYPQVYYGSDYTEL
ncbi:recombinase family protein [Ammoniphilus sp. CFH 90114]|uniref:recombinase family protein n=1 Tax=Ammoniphilus sp. CFH 90114 TaxID=2493665 RepID=UPI00100FA956|nr:recombinase family protein [Ammoniphilus sp. CFH 90114]RXT03650.1 recombinase family protein [Ammoniphilus sp. CFH 90114]